MGLLPTTDENPFDEAGNLKYSATPQDFYIVVDALAAGSNWISPRAYPEMAWLLDHEELYRAWYSQLENGLYIRPDVFTEAAVLALVDHIQHVAEELHWHLTDTNGCLLHANLGELVEEVIQGDSTD